MPRKPYTEEQIGFALRQVEAGTSVPELCRKLGIAGATFYRWKKKFAGLGIAEIRRLKQLEDENRRLKQIVADLTLDKAMLQDVARRNGDAPHRRAAVSYLQAAYGLSERRASTGISRTLIVGTPTPIAVAMTVSSVAVIALIGSARCDGVLWPHPTRSRGRRLRRPRVRGLRR